MTDWEQVCRERLAAARSADQSDRVARRATREWVRRLWWARRGNVVTGVAGSVLGGLIGYAIARVIVAVLS